jgi:hypothetical protein
MFFTCSTKFGVTLINSNPKNFRYDMVWVKSAPCGFLNAKKMPMKKHEMVYVFYRKLPFYDLSSHKHKFLKEVEYTRGGSVYPKGGKLKETSDLSCYEPTLHVSVLRDDSVMTLLPSKPSIYMNTPVANYNNRKGSDPAYDPPLPTTILGLPTQADTAKTVLRETLYGNIDIPEYSERKKGEPRYEPSLPTTVLGVADPSGPRVQERVTSDAECYDGAITYNYEDRDGAMYDPPLPNTLLEIKSEKGKHPTQKPTALIEWCLKYYSKEGDTVLDPTMGSGSTGVACKNMNRKFIGIEMDVAIFEVAKKRLN